MISWESEIHSIEQPISFQAFCYQSIHSPSFEALRLNSDLAFDKGKLRIPHTFGTVIRSGSILRLSFFYYLSSSFCREEKWLNLGN